MFTLFSSCESIFKVFSSFKRYSNSAVMFYCCVDMGKVVICTSCFLFPRPYAGEAELSRLSSATVGRDHAVQSSDGTAMDHVLCSSVL